VASTWDTSNSVETQFYFNPQGGLEFRAQIGIGGTAYLYQAVNIGYKYNIRTHQMAIGHFVARGNYPQMPYLSVSALSGLQHPTRGSSLNMLLKVTDVLGLSDVQIDPDSAGFRFSEALLFKLSARDNSPLSYQQYMAGIPPQALPQNPGGLPPQYPNANVTFPINGPGVGSPGQVDPRFNYGTVNTTKFLVVGGNVLLMPLELLPAVNSAQRLDGIKPAYVPFDDSRI
jgi:hypothetical protein